MNGDMLDGVDTPDNSTKLFSKTVGRKTMAIIGVTDPCRPRVALRTPESAKQQRPRSQDSKHGRN